MIGYIYLTTNLINNKKYIGRKTSETFVPTYFGSGVHLKRALNKYGADNFKVELLKECYSVDDLIQSETYYIKLYNAVNDDSYYNHSYGGYNEGFIPGEQNIAKTDYCRKLNSEKHRGKKMSDEFRKKQSEIHRGKSSGMLGKHHSEETKMIISEYSKNRRHTQEQIDKIKNHHTGCRMMNNGVLQKWVCADEVNTHLSMGWKFGACFKRNRDYSNNFRSEKFTAKDRKWIHMYDESGNLSRKYVFENDVEKYLLDGWKKGMK